MHRLPLRGLHSWLFLGLVAFVMMSQSMLAQASTIYIAIVNSTQAPQEQDLTQRIETNTKALLRGKHKVVFQRINGDNGDNADNNAARIRQQLRRLQHNKRTDIIIATGIVASQQLAHVKDFRKPSIASTVIDERLQRMSQPLVGRSGIKNFTYVKSQFNVAADLKKLRQLYPFKKLGVVADASLKLERPFIQQVFSGFTSKPFEVFYVSPKNYKKQLAAAQKQVDALYVLPLFTFNQQQITQFFTEVTTHKLPSFALLGRSYTKAGALAGQSASDHAEVHARRISLNIMKIVDGKPAASLPIHLPLMPNDFVINMQTANDIGIYPDFSVLQQADVIGQLKNHSQAQTMSFQEALSMALSKNLDLQKAKKDIALAKVQISEAKRAFLPSLDLTYQGTKVDKDFRLTQAAGITQKVSARATQVLFSDEALALYKARKLGVDANVEALKRTEYQVVYDVLLGFVQHLNAKRQAEIQHENTSRTRKTLEVAKRKDATGYAGKLDVYRLESELAINQANLSQAQARFVQTQLALKKLLNMPLSKKINFLDIKNPTRLLSVGNKTLFNDLNNQKKVDLFTDYLLHIAMSHRPAIIQYDRNIAAQQHLADAERRKWYMPTVSLAANANRTFARHDKVPNRTPPTMSPKWDVSLVASLPVFDRQQRTNNLKNAINIDKLKLEKEDLVKSISLGLRSDMQTAIASYSQMLLYKQSAESARKNFELVANLYKYGGSNITNLIDAQNNVLSTKLNAINAEQQFFVDYLKVEQQSGFYYFLATPEKKAAFVTGFTQFAQQHQHEAANANTQATTAVSHHTQQKNADTLAISAE